MKIATATKGAYDLFRKGSVALAHVEHNGIRVNTEYVNDTIKTLEKKIAVMAEELKDTKVYRKWGEKYKNPKLDSTQQLGDILFSPESKGGMGYPVLERTPTGQPKTDEKAIEKTGDPFAVKFLLRKKYGKLLGTYFSGLQRETDHRGFLHPFYNLSTGVDERTGGARSYRGSCNLTNFQNYPVRNPDMAPLIRKAFIPRGKDYVIGEIDYSTIEVRVAAAVTGDKRLKKYVSDESKDMHRDSAEQLFLLKSHEVGKKTTRDAAKNKFVFPQFYGDYWKTCAANMWEMMERGKWKIEGSDTLVIDHLKKKGIRKLGNGDDVDPTPDTFEYRVKKVQDIFWNEWWVEYTAWKEELFKEYLKTGYVRMPTGFVASGCIMRKNQVLNMPIQGPAFHCVLLSIIMLDDYFRRHRMRSKIIGQIHDCILIDIHKSEIQKVLTLCKKVMTKLVPKEWSWINVPLKVEADIVPSGMTWNDKSSWIEDDKGIWMPKT